MSRRDGAIVAWHEVPLEFGHYKKGGKGPEIILKIHIFDFKFLS